MFGSLTHCKCFSRFTATNDKVVKKRSLNKSVFELKQIEPDLMDVFLNFYFIL